VSDTEKAVRRGAVEPEAEVRVDALSLPEVPGRAGVDYLRRAQMVWIVANYSTKDAAEGV